MTTKIIRYNESLQQLFEWIDINISDKNDILVIRDISGILHVLIKNDSIIPVTKRKEYEIKLKKLLGAYAPKDENIILTSDDISNADEIFDDDESIKLRIKKVEIKFLDRMIIGQDWIKAPFAKEEKDTNNRIIFYGLKGGVGRSTALSIASFELAKKGKKVLILDFDLESPGISSLLFSYDHIPEFGIVDWFVEDMVGQSDSVIEEMIAPSPISSSLTGKIFVVPAFGANDLIDDKGGYISKLARVYSDGLNDEIVETFADRMFRLITRLEAKIKPDVILIDSRAGLHDLAAISISRLSASLILLFAIDSPQTWNSYRLLFSHWQKYPEVLNGFKENLQIVDAMMPETEQQSHEESFLENSYNLFSLIYDEIPPGDVSVDKFNYNLEAKEAPHSPLKIRWNRRFQEFDPVKFPDLLTDPEVDVMYGHFLKDIYDICGIIK